MSTRRGLVARPLDRRAEAERRDVRGSDVRRTLRLLALLALCPLAACTQARLEEAPPMATTARDDRLEISGELATRDPETRVFPLRVMFIVDASMSMDITDPPDPVSGESRRELAVRGAWTDLLGRGGDAGVSILRFSGFASPQTPVDEDGDGQIDTYFTSDPNLLEAATVSLGATSGLTNYINALDEAYLQLRNEMVGADQESLPLSKYVVVFLSDGVPDVDDNETRDNVAENILERVEALTELAALFRVGDFTFHTAYLSAGQGPALDQPAQELLQQMAKEGEGTYRSFPNGEALNFLTIDFSIIRRVFTLKQLAVVNTNAVADAFQIPRRPLEPLDDASFLDLDGDDAMTCGEPMVDSDGDGLADHVELRIGSNPLDPDTDDDGLSDRIEWDFRMSGQDPIDPDDARCFLPDLCEDEDDDGFCDCVLDSDGDGTCDCVAQGTCLDTAGHDCLDADADGLCDCPDRDGDGRCDWPDDDGDGLRDCEEVYYGTRFNGNDTDGDGLPDALEVRFRTSPVQADNEADLDWDATPNASEILGGSDPLCDDSPLRSLASYRYRKSELGLVGSSTHHTFDVNNVILMPTLGDEAAEREPGWNRILVYAGEVAFDDPTTFAAYRVACVEARYDVEADLKYPPSGRMVLTDEDFVDTRELDPEVHCVRP